MERLLELGTILALLGVPLACSTWLADAVMLPKQALFTVAATLTVAIWLAGWRAGRWPLGRRGWWVGLAAAPYLWSLAGTLAAGWPLEGLSPLSLGLGLAGLSFAWNATLTPERERRWLGYVALTAALLAAYSWLQRLGLDPVAWNYPHLSRDRTIATVGNPDFLALYLVVAGPLALERILEWRGAARLAGLAAWLLGCQAMILTTTRGSWVAALAAAAVWLWQARRRPQLTLALALALGLLLLATSYAQRAKTDDFTVVKRVQSLGNLQENSFTARLYLWYSAWRLGNRSPLLGQGWGTFSYLALEFRAWEPQELRILQRLPEDPHSHYLLWLAVGGYPALLLWLLSLAIFLRHAPTPGARCAGVALAVNLLFLTCPLETEVLWMLLFACAASRQAPLRQGPLRKARLELALALAASLAALWWGGRAVASEWEIWWGDEYQLQNQPELADARFARAAEWAGPGQLATAVERRGRLRLLLLHRGGPQPELAAQALAAYQEASRLSPLNPYPWAEQARVHGVQGDLARAEQAWRQALGRDPRNPRFHAELGLLYARHGRFAEALGCLDEALAIFPDQVEFMLHKAHILLDLKQEAQAEQLFVEILKRDPARRKEVEALRERQ